MKTSAILFCVTLLAALLTVSREALAQVTPPEPYKVMPLGDSITTTDYRYYMYNSLVAAGGVHNVHFDFIGSEYGGNASGTWDKDHEGHGGYTTDQLLTGRESGADGIKEQADAGTFVAPDVVCLLTGTNDIGYDWGKMVRDQNDGIVDPDAGETIPLYAVHETINDIRNVVGFLREQNPNVRIALSTGIPSTEERRHYAPGTLEALKDEIVKLVEGTYVVPEDLDPAPSYAIGNTGAWKPAPERLDPSEFVSGGISTEASPVVLVDHWTGFDTDTMLIDDGIHPNPAGEVLIGERFATAIEPWVVPEPATGLYLGAAGAAGLARKRRRKKARNNKHTQE